MNMRYFKNNGELIATVLNDVYNLPLKPTITLIDTSNIFHLNNNIIKRLIEIGTKYFVLYGKNADKLNNEIDDLIESDDKYLDIITMVYLDCDIASFFINSIYLEKGSHRFLVISENQKFIQNVIKTF